MSEKPKIILRQKNEETYKKAIDAGLTPLQAQILSTRDVPADIPIEHFINPKLNYLSKPRLQDMSKACDRLASAIINQECIGIETDHDCDGQTSHAVIYDTLIRHFKHPKDKVRSYIGHRLEEGYGLSVSVANRILKDDPRPTLVITADNGSTDEPRIAMLKEHGIDVIVTDHHHIPAEGVPKSALACLNPTREDCEYKDPYVAGCMVAWLLMASTRAVLIDKQHLDGNIPKLSDTLDFVAVGTVADCVSLSKSLNNRIVIKHGLKLINSGTRACWQVLKRHLGKELTEEDIGFGIGPLLNSDGRLKTAFQSVSLLLSGSTAEAERWLHTLIELNDERKKIQNKITSQGYEKAQIQVANGDFSLRVFLEDGHAGVHGISASRLKDQFGRPTVFLANKSTDNTLVTGSLRGIEGFDIKYALSEIAKDNPELLTAFGGHVGAGGVTLPKNNLPKFIESFERFSKTVLTKEAVGPRIYVDGYLSEPISINIVNEVDALQPFGREFEQPSFLKKVKLLQFQWVGDGTHLRVLFDSDGRSHWGIWFRARAKDSDLFELNEGDIVDLVFSLKRNNKYPNKCDVQIVSAC